MSTRFRTSQACPRHANPLGKTGYHRRGRAVANVVRFTLHAHFCLTFVPAPFSVVLGSAPQYLSMISKASVHRICGSTDRRARTVYLPKAV